MGEECCSDYVNEMTLNQYQEQTEKTAKCPGMYRYMSEPEYIPAYEALGLAGEAGEAVDVIKKMCRHETTLGMDNKELREKLKLELGDVLWYLARLATQFDWTLEDIAKANQEKLLKRYPERNEIQRSVQTNKD